MKKSIFSLLVLVAAVSLPALAADAPRQAEVAKPLDGGTQRVVAKNAADEQQINLVREHMLDIRSQFLKGDFSRPSHIHGADMPGLAELRSSKPGQLSIEYKDLKAGAELAYRTADPKMVAALHQWFDAQLSDHGADAMAGHRHHDHGAMKM